MDREELIKRVSKLSEGNPGAVTATMELYKAFGDAAIEGLEATGLVGPDIWVLYKDQCGYNTDAMMLKLVELAQAL